VEFEIKAGAKIDLLTQKELADTLRSWQSELRRGIRYRRFGGTAIVAAAGTVTIGGPEDTAKPVTGPSDGFYWAIKRLTVHGLGDGKEISVYLNDVSPTALIAVIPESSGYILFPDRCLILDPGDALIFSGASLLAESRITVNGQAREAPEPALWAL
jgi:hypothetical protein